MRVWKIAALFRSTDGAKHGKNFRDCAIMARAEMATGRGRNVSAHDYFDPKAPGRIVIAISAAGAFRTDDGGETWKPINRGLASN